MKYGFIKVAAGVPQIRVADPAYNVGELITLTERAAKLDARVLVFPELCLTGCTAGDLFLSDTLLSSAEDALKQYLSATAKLDMIAIVGLPLCRNNKTYNVAAVCHMGKLLGFVPKTAISAGEARCFATADGGRKETAFDGAGVPFGTDLIFAADRIGAFKIAVEFGADTELLVPPSTKSVAAGATLICSPAASFEAVEKADYRRACVKAQSAKALASYVYVSAGAGESTTDLVFGGHAMIVENGTLLAEKEAFANEDLLITEVDKKYKEKE